MFHLQMGKKKESLIPHCLFHRDILDIISSQILFISKNCIEQYYNPARLYFEFFICITSFNPYNNSVI